MDIDVTFLLQFAILLALMLLLERLLHRPILVTLAKRHEQTHGVLAEVRSLDKLTAADAATLEARLDEAKQKLHQEREALRTDGRKQARAIEDAARDHLVKARAAARSAADSLEATTQAQLAPAKARWQRALVSRALGRAEAN